MGVNDAMEEKVPPIGITEKLVVPPKLIVTAIQTFTVMVNVPLPLLMGADARVMSVSLHDLAVSFAKQMSRNKVRLSLRNLSLVGRS